MRRRQFISFLGLAVAVWPLAAKAQQAGKVVQVGLLWDSPEMFPKAIQSFRRELRDLGWVEGQNLHIDYRWTEGRFNRLNEIAEELAASKVDLIVAPSSIYTGAAKRATSTILIVFMSHADPLGSGHVTSLGRPRGNITGLSLMMTETNAKLLEVFKEAIPGLMRVAVIWDPATPSHGPGLNAVEVAGRALGLRIQTLAVSHAAELNGAFSTIVRESGEGVLVLSTPPFIAAASRFAELGIEHKLPTMFGPKEHAEAGGFLSFGPDRADLWRRGATYVDKILKGAKAADLPVQQPTKFELVVNLKTARTLGLTVAPSFVLRADEVIE